MGIKFDIVYEHRLKAMTNDDTIEVIDITPIIDYEAPKSETNSAYEKGIQYYYKYLIKYKDITA